MEVLVNYAILILIVVEYFSFLYAPKVFLFYHNPFFRFFNYHNYFGILRKFLGPAKTDELIQQAKDAEVVKRQRRSYDRGR